MLAAQDWPLDTFSNMSCVPWPKAEECRPWLGLRGSWYVYTHYPRAKPVFISRLLFPRSATIRTRSYLGASFCLFLSAMYKPAAARAARPTFSPFVSSPDEL